MTDRQLSGEPASPSRSSASGEIARRRLLQIVVATGAVTAVDQLVPGAWARPWISTGTLPAYALSAKGTSTSSGGTSSGENTSGGTSSSGGTSGGGTSSGGTSGGTSGGPPPCGASQLITCDSQDHSTSDKAYPATATSNAAGTKIVVSMQPKQYVLIKGLKPGQSVSAGLAVDPNCANTGCKPTISIYVGAGPTGKELFGASGTQACPSNVAAAAASDGTLLLAYDGDPNPGLLITLTLG